MKTGLPIEAVKLALTYEIGNGTAVDVFGGQSLAIEGGTFVAIVGESGCGKTSLLRLTSGLIQPTAGEIRLGQERPEAVLAKRKIAIVFQKPVLLPWRTVQQNVELPGRLSRSDSITDRAVRAIEQVGLAGFDSAYPRQLSGGMQARVALARVLVQQPAVLLMDEPFAALDEITRLKFDIEMLRLWKEQRWTVLFVTHSIEEAVLLSDRVLIMGRRPAGVVLAVDTNLPRDRTLDSLDLPLYQEKVARIRHELRKISGTQGKEMA